MPKKKVKPAQVRHKNPGHYQLVAAVVANPGRDQKELAKLMGIDYFNANKRFARLVRRANRADLIEEKKEDKLKRYYPTVTGVHLARKLLAKAEGKKL